MKLFRKQDVDKTGAERGMNIIWDFEFLSARVVLYLLSLGSIATMYIIRATLSFTIIAMVKERPYNKNVNLSKTLCFDYSNTTNVLPNNYGGTLNWSINQQYYVLTSFYWTYLMSHTISGTVVQKFGTKKTFGWSLVATSVCQLCIPFTSSRHYMLVIALQLIQGLSQGLIWPALYAAIGIWIPVQERSRFVTCFQGSALGIALVCFLAGLVIAEFGWVYVFYGTGTIGLLCALLWYLLMYDTPEQHPRIDKKELQYIQEYREHSYSSDRTIPWSSILKSLPVWAVAVSAFGRMWVLAIFTTYSPLYFTGIVGLSLEKAGFILGTCTFIGYVSSLLLSFTSDKIIAYKLMPLVYNRKMFSVTGQIFSGILFLTMGYIVECNIPLIIAITYLIQFFLMANFVGNMTNIVDLSPSYAAPVSSFVQIILLMPTVLATFVLKTFLQNENKLLAWSHTLSISCGVSIFTALFYAIFASAKVQPWDSSTNSWDLKHPNAKKNLLNNDQPA
ncbi:hypothetical protein FQR65_LT05454 [Abscondita terminalis]|nr:hypothetical protein FQR65_LT05454 [Abscondita terminalis]